MKEHISWKLWFLFRRKLSVVIARLSGCKTLPQPFQLWFPIHSSNGLLVTVKSFGLFLLVLWCISASDREIMSLTIPLLKCDQGVPGWTVNHKKIEILILLNVQDKMLTNLCNHKTVLWLHAVEKLAKQCDSFVELLNRVFLKHPRPLIYDYTNTSGLIQRGNMDVKYTTG